MEITPKVYGATPSFSDAICVHIPGAIGDTIVALSEILNLEHKEIIFVISSNKCKQERLDMCFAFRMCKTVLDFSDTSLASYRKEYPHESLSKCITDQYGCEFIAYEPRHRIDVDNLRHFSESDFSFGESRFSFDSKYVLAQPVTRCYKPARHKKDFPFFRELSCHIAEVTKLPMYTIGHQDDIEALKSIHGGIKNNLAGKTTILEAMRLVADAELVISTTTWSGLFAAAMNRKVCMLFNKRETPFYWYFEKLGGYSPGIIKEITNELEARKYFNSIMKRR